MQLFIYLQLHRALLFQTFHDLQFFRWEIKRITYKAPASWISMILFLRIFQFLFWGNEGYWKSSHWEIAGGDVEMWICDSGELRRKENCYLWSKLLLRRVLYRTLHIWVCLPGWHRNGNGSGLRVGARKVLMLMDSTIMLSGYQRAGNSKLRTRTIIRTSNFKQLTGWIFMDSHFFFWLLMVLFN